MVARYDKLDLPTYWSGINPDSDRAISARVDSCPVWTSPIPRDFVTQQLGYSKMYADRKDHP